MPICYHCRGAGILELEVKNSTRCPDCDGSKVRPDGEKCTRCNKRGEILTGGYKIERELCHTCWGSGKIPLWLMYGWLSLRAVPITLIVLFGGLLLTLGLWVYLSLVPLTSMMAMTVLLSWAILFYRMVIRHLRSFGGISAISWFFWRATPTSIVVLGMGSAAVWLLFSLTTNVRFALLLGLSVLLIWVIFMFYFMLDLPDS